MPQGKTEKGRVREEETSVPKGHELGSRIPASHLGRCGCGACVLGRHRPSVACLELSCPWAFASAVASARQALPPQFGCQYPTHFYRRPGSKAIPVPAALPNLVPNLLRVLSTSKPHGPVPVHGQLPRQPPAGPGTAQASPSHCPQCPTGLRE